jgi:hypothetical protein
VAAGASCSISVSFKPTASGQRTGTVTVFRQRQPYHPDCQPHRNGRRAWGHALPSFPHLRHTSRGYEQHRSDRHPQEYGHLDPHHRQYHHQR